MSSQILMPTFTGESDHADYEDSVLRFNIKALLAKSKDVTQTSLAKRFGITTAGMSQKINKPGRVTVRDAVIIADELGVTLDELLDDRAMLEEIERQREETGLLMDLGRRLQGSNARRNNPSSPKYLVGPDGLVPPVGLEPTTHDLKGRCSNH